MFRPPDVSVCNLGCFCDSGFIHEHGVTWEVFSIKGAKVPSVYFCSELSASLKIHS